MPRVASGTAGAVGETDSVTVAPMDMPELTSPAGMAEQTFGDGVDRVVALTGFPQDC